ncbi:MAG TPA: hypothetical protein VGE07_24715 [Herpetosiphonaceae bacterium]
MLHRTSRWATIGPALLFLGLIALFVNSSGDPKTHYAPLSAYFEDSQASVPVSQVTPLPPAVAVRITTSDADGASDQIDLVLEADLYRDEQEALLADLQGALGYVQQRTGIGLAGRVRVVLSQDEACGFHGVTYSDIRVIYIYSCAGIARQRVVNIAAHEFVHQLEQDRYGPPHLAADLILSEGFATWGAGRYWLGGKQDFAAFAREYRDSGAALPLGTHYASVGLGGMNVLYYQWASFVDYLLATYGRERFDQLYVSGGGQQPGQAQYAATYGQSFAQLEEGWRRWRDQ